MGAAVYLVFFTDKQSRVFVASFGTNLDYGIVGDLGCPTTATPQ